MKIDWLRPLSGQTGPFASVYVDGTHVEAGSRDFEGRMRGVLRDLAAQGAPASVGAAIEEVLARPLRLAGPHGRVVVANEDAGVLVDRVLSDPPTVQRAVWGPVPVLLEAARSADQAVDRLLVVVDRQGADLSWSWGGDPSRQPEPLEVEGEHDDIALSRSGTPEAGPGTRDGHAGARAEDSWGRNAEKVAREVDAQVAEHRPELVLLSGDVRAVALVKDALGRRTRDLLVEVPGGTRHQPPSSAFAAKVAEAEQACRARRSQAVLDRYREGVGRAEGAVSSLADVVTVLQRGQVAELILGDTTALTGGSAGEDDGVELWAGPDPLAIATSRDEVVGLGVDAEADVHPLPAITALVRAALGQDAGLTFVEGDAVDLVDGVGAVLRWSDGSTPSESAPTMSADRRRLRDVV